MLSAKLKKFAQITFSFLVLVTTVLIINPGKAEAIGVNRMFQDPNNHDKFYFVGMVYYETWSNAAGQWVNTPPGGKTDVDGFDYMFEFNSSRKIKDIRVSKFDYNRQYGDKIFEASRSVEMAQNPRDYYIRATSPSYFFLEDNGQGKVLTLPTFLCMLLMLS